MDLDNRIIKGKSYLDCFNTEIGKEFIGKECYLSDGVASFANIDNLRKATLIEVVDGDVYPYKLENARWHYGSFFILPCEWVKGCEKKYRPFTPDEFTDTFTIGEPIIFRRKQSKRLYEYNVLFIGCCFSGDNTDVVLGNDRFSLETLFNNYEWRQHDSYEWKSFGMEE